MIRKLLLTAVAAVAAVALGAALGAAATGQAQPAPPSMDQLYQTIGNSVAMAAANAVYAQQQVNIDDQASSTVAVSQLYGIETSTAGALAADPRARAVLDAQLPGLTSHPAFPTSAA